MRDIYDRRDHFNGNHCWCRPRIIDLGVCMLIQHRRVDPSTVSSRYEQIREEDESSGIAANWNNDYGMVDDNE